MTDYQFCREFCSLLFVFKQKFDTQIIVFPFSFSLPTAFLRMIFVFLISTDVRFLIIICLAELFSPFCLSRTKYETPAMIEAKMSGRVVAVCGERYCGGDVVATLCQRGYNAALIRAGWLPICLIHISTFCNTFK